MFMLEPDLWKNSLFKLQMKLVLLKVQNLGNLVEIAASGILGPKWDYFFTTVIPPCANKDLGQTMQTKSVDPLLSLFQQRGCFKSRSR